MTFDDKDPPWMTEKLKGKIKWEEKVYGDYLKNGKTEPDFMYVHHTITKVSQLILESKDKYYNNLKTYWSILETFYNAWFLRGY